jgi:amino acid adenylation domain-containing protein
MAGEPPPASFAQQRLWFLEQLAGPSAQHNLSVVCRLQGVLNPQALEQGLAGLLQRHAVLRTTLHWQDGRLLQRVHETMPFALPMTDLGSQDEPRRQQLAHECAAAQAAQPFDLARPPWLRARLLRLTPQEHWLALTFHHLAFDGWSFEVFMAELGALYGAFGNGDACPLAEPALQYADYAAWQRRWMSASALQPQLDYWKRQLAGPLPVLRLPADRPRTSFAARRGASLPLALPADLSQRIRKLAADEGVTPSTLLLAAFQVLLHRYTGDEDIIVGTPVAQRARPELARLVGPLLNMLALRADLAGKPTFREFLARANATAQDAFANQELAFEQLVEALDLRRSNDAAPGVQVTFTYQNLPPSGWSFPGLQCEAWNVPSGSAAFEASLAMWERNGALGGLLDYDAGLFDAASMQQLLACFGTLLQAIADDADTRVDRLALLPASSLQALRDWNATRVPYPRDATVHALFEAQAARTPDRVTLAWRGGQLSYADLDRRADTLARLLGDAGVVPGHRVAVRLAPGPAFVIAALAVLKCGAAYVPLSPMEPVARVKAGLRGARVACVIGQVTQEPLAPALGAALVVLERAGAGVLAARAAAGAGPASASGIACVMFTSGSTGVPKGVCVPHRGVVRLVHGQRYARMGPDEVLLQLAPVAFDASAFEIWAALLHGGTLAFPAVQQPSLAEIGDAVREHGVTTLWLTTGLFEAMVDHRLADIAGCRQLLVGGDVLPVAHALRFLRAAPDCSLTNFYGPTENATFTSFCPLSIGLLEGAASVPIGRPIANTQLWVLDPLGQPVPQGVAGEAWVGGDGVMPGYLNDPQASAQCLEPDPFGAGPGALRYRTGDRVRLRSDGQLEFIGRLDRQLKLRGLRVEPGECEQVLAASPLVQAVAVVAQVGAGGLQLVAHIVPLPTVQTAELESALRSHVQALLPPQLRPSAWAMHQALPLDASGKIDRRALMAHQPDAVPQRASGPAATGADSAVASAFAQVLGRPEIDPDASFFDLGGHSLLALKLVGVLEQALGAKLPLALLFRHSSVASLSAALRLSQPEGGQLPPGLVELRRGRSQPALFIVPGGRGGRAEMTLYARLLGHAGGSLAAWGLLARGFDGREPPHASVAAMASDGIAQVCRMQPAGPWLIAGECVGGVIAHEMVRQMRERGLEAALLLMDSWCPTDAGVQHYWRVQRPRTLARERRMLLRSAWADLGGVLRQHLRERPAFGLRSWVLYGGRVARTLVRIAAAWRSRIARVGQAEPGQEAAAAVGENYIAVAMHHRPAPGEMRAALLVTERNLSSGLAGDWQRLLPGLQVVTVPGDHESYLRDTPEATAQGFMTCLAALGFAER